ncbi:hypothetical protein C4546_02210 [Candidatus Parcubacteria bacterium]|jgi:predicted PurR-regulated permease PerM|nr:MAG: hypothetical protein C4546_02210 [Candidatus Parcubacteria bacterium]
MSTGDILNIVIAFVLLAVGGFLVWLLYYLVQIIKTVNQAVQEFRKMIESIHHRLEHLGEILDAIQNKVSSSASAIAGIVKAVGEVVTFVQSRRAKKKNTKSQTDSE